MAMFLFFDVVGYWVGWNEAGGSTYSMAAKISCLLRCGTRKVSAPGGERETKKGEGGSFGAMVVCKIKFYESRGIDKPRQPDGHRLNAVGLGE